MPHRNPHVPLRLYNTLTRSLEPFRPMDGEKARLYTCGPTVYNFAHIGNLRTYIFEDLLKRTIRYNAMPVLHVMNITDVGHLTSDADDGEDKMEKGAKREGKTAWEIAEFYTDAFKRDLLLLNITEPDIWCKATDHIPEQIAQIQQLEQKGFTYIIEDGVYFDTAKLPDYGKLARLDIENLRAGARIEMAQGKRNPTDFALWKLSPDGERRQMEWDSPWGKGFPGWHIECSAMSMKYLGEQFDIHCGGIDHIPVHHTNEIAQAEAATGKQPWVQLWMHGEFLVIDKGKMAKSGENFFTLQAVTDKGFNPLIYRYFCLTASYDQQLSFSWESLETAKNGYDSIKTKIISLHDESSGESVEGVEHNLRASFLEAINENLNMPKALAVLWALLREENLAAERKLELAVEFDEVLGLGIARFGTELIPEDITQLAIEREAARQAKNWARSDELRAAINAKGYIVDDKKEGFALRKA